MCAISPSQQRILADVIDQFCRKKEDFSADDIKTHCGMIHDVCDLTLDRISTELSKAYSGIAPYGDIFPVGYVVQRVRASDPKVAFKIYHWSDYARRKNDELVKKHSRSTNSEIIVPEDCKIQNSGSDLTKIADDLIVKNYGLPGDKSSNDVIARISAQSDRPMCKNCNKRPVCYDGAVFCGAACTAMYESKRSADRKSRDPGNVSSF